MLTEEPPNTYDDNPVLTEELVLQRDYEGLTNALRFYRAAHDDESLRRVLSFAMDPDLTFAVDAHLGPALREFADSHGWKIALRAVADVLPSTR